MPKVSVIMPVYNRAQLIAESIESILMQTWQDWELIVVDDGSTDATLEIVQRFADPRIVVIHQENQGAAVARNTGLDQAQGEYVVFLDADDLYFPHALSDLVDYLDTHAEADAVYSDGYMCDADLKPLLRLSEHRPGAFTGNILEHVVLSGSAISAIMSTMIRRATIERFGIRFDRNMPIGQDWDFWIQLARFAEFGYLDRLTCMYRIHETNTTRTTRGKLRRETLVYGRLKVLNQNWFPDLSTATQYTFFYNLLVGLLSDAPMRQQEILHTAPFVVLPARERAHLLRLIASDHLLRRRAPDFARDCLREAVAAQPGDRRSRILLALSDRSLLLCSFALSVWQIVHKAAQTLRSLGQKSSKPAPLTLAPVSD